MHCPPRYPPQQVPGPYVRSQQECGWVCPPPPCARNFSPIFRSLAWGKSQHHLYACRWLVPLLPGERRGSGPASGPHPQRVRYSRTVRGQEERRSEPATGSSQWNPLFPELHGNVSEEKTGVLPPLLDPSLPQCDLRHIVLLVLHSVEESLHFLGSIQVL